MLSQRRIARSLVIVFFLTFIQTVVAPVLNISTPSAEAATLYANVNDFQQFTNWQGVNYNHTPYQTASGTTPIASNSSTINLTQNVGSQWGFLWNTRTFSYDQDLSVSGTYFFGTGNPDGADMIAFFMKPTAEWPNDGIAGSASGGVASWASGEIRAIFDTYKNGIEMTNDHLTIEGVKLDGTTTTLTYTNGEIGVPLKDSAGNTVTELENNATHDYTITWTASSRTFAVYAGLSANTLIYSTVISSAQMDATTFSFGWGGFTGGAYNYQSVQNVTYHVSPTVATASSDTTVVDGTSVTLNASHTSSETSPTTRWEYSTDGGSTWTTTGTTTASYTFTATRSLNQRKYRYFVQSTAAGTTFSRNTTPITLTVNGLDLKETDTALTFNGTNQYAQAAENDLFDITGAITIEAWVYQTGFVSGIWNLIVNKEGSYELGTVNGTWHYALMGNAGWVGVNTQIPATLNTWQHIAITRAASTNEVKFYLNGYLVFTGTADGAGTGPIANSNSPFSISARETPSNGYWKGQLDEIRLFASARTAEEILTDMNTYGPIDDANLRLYFDGNEGSGSKIYNRKFGATGGSDVTLYNTPTFTDVKSVDPSSYGAYTTVKFPRTYLNSSGGWRVPSGISKMSYLVVAGGGAGGATTSAGNHQGGGGGGGGVRTGLINSPSGFISAQVGPGQRFTTCKLERGRNSALTGTAITTISATGGGSGGCYNGSSFIAGNTGGSGGGGAVQVESSSPGTGNLGGYAPVEGFIGGVGFPHGSDGRLQGGGGGGGAGGAGGAATSGTAGIGGAGKVLSFSGSFIGYGGGGGGGARSATNGGAASDGGGSGGISGAQGSSGVDGRGGGGGGTSTVTGNDGGMGVVFVRWLNITKPAFTYPTNAYLNVGMTETFTTNVATDSATAAFTRTFKWESSTTGSNGTFSIIKQGTGATNAAFSWVPTNTSTSGSNYVYRVNVTDSDAEGLSVQDTSTPVWAVINLPLSVTGTTTIAKRINLSKNETFTITLGTSTYRPVLSPVIPGITLDTSTAGSAIIKISETMTVGTYYETLTVTDSVSASIVTPLTIVVAAPPQLTNSAEIVTNGLVFNFDASNSASFNFNTGAMSDISGAAKPITRVNTNTYSAENLGALTFNSTSDSGPYAYFNKSVQMPKFTVETYVRLNGSSVVDHFCPLVSEYTTGVIGFALCIDSARTFYSGFRSSTAWTYKRSAAVIPMNTWTHLVGTFDGSEMRIYLNGNLVTTYASTNGSSTVGGLSPFVPSTDKVYINRDYNSAAVTPGNTSYGYIRLYNIGFSQSEVTQNLDATKNRFLSANSDAITPSHKYGNTTTETYTVTSGYGSDTISYATGNKAGVKLETTTSLVTLKMQESLTATTHYETITVTDSLGASTYLPIKMTVTKADTLTISMDTKTVVTYNGSPITSYPKLVIKGLAGLDTFTVTTKFSSSLYTKSATVPTSADTYTVIAEDPVFGLGALSNYVNVVYETSTAVVNKAKQPSLSVFLYGGTVGQAFPISVLGGGGDGAISETVTAGGTMTGCTISNHSLTATSTNQGFCRVYIVKAASQNYLSESVTVDMYFMAYINNQPTGQVGSGATIGLNGVTSFDTSTVQAPSITGLSTTSISLTGGGTLTITGTGFGGTITVKFWRNKTIDKISGDSTTISVSAAELASIGATSGRIAVITTNGEGVSVQSLTITP